ncbi:hypothetical protein WICPIJ_000954 [Wickerhamomyces pijperi]|uniref:N2227-domain-containing protein n=1 Tax=Wickerhamomyces pijperi TaxID=599730 RepID=A0A9P8QCR1_WICPI|nr:hypothetical protein WICPIJ_000954 [Wickerhamomyces pijperi]
MSSSTNTELQFLITRISLLLLIYSLAITYFPVSKIPTLLLVFGMASSVYKTSNFKWLINKFINMDLTSERQDIVNAIGSLKRYETLALAWNNHKIRNFKRVSYEYQKQAIELGYQDHLNQTDGCIKNNGDLCRAIAGDATARYQINEVEQRACLYSQNNSKVIEAITHYARDWSQLGDDELKPLMEYIKENIERNITPEDRKKTVILVPGSGLGRIAYELASITGPQFKSVQSIEFSTLMHLCNEFIYSQASKNTTFNLHPYIHTYSHHVTRENHHRHIELSLHKTKPSNLTTNLADFRKYQIPDSEKEYENVVIVTCFFMDTAQNMFEYFKAIESQIKPSQRGIWINIGPLKYGTAPVVEFSLDEIRELRKIRGWKDIDEPMPYGSQMAGYLTDEKGLWKGYYGLGRWTSVYEGHKK